VSALQALGGFVAELRRRHVVRVGIVYCAVGWILAEVSSTVFPALGIPDWSISLVVMLLIMGLPLALALAWAFDLTPAGVQRTPPRATAVVQHPAAARHPAAVERHAAAPLPSILALPFVDRSVGADHQYLGDGITEELINSLARVAGVRVVSRTSAFALRAAALDVREVGARLGVSHVVEGSVGVAGARLRLTVQLVAVDDGYAVWSRTFDRSLDDVFCVQEEVAGAIVHALAPALLQGPAADAPGDAAGRSVDFETYALYLRGRQQWNGRTPASLRTAIDYFQRAIRRDGTYAPAHAGLADCWAILVDHGIIAPADGLPPARAAASRALRLDPRLAEAHASVALVNQLEWRWTAAASGFRDALELNPGCIPARQRLALLFAWRGRFDEARSELRHARRADPLSPVLAASEAWVEYCAGRHEDAIAITWRLLGDDPAATQALAPLALALAATGRAADAVAVLGDSAPLAEPLLGIRAYVLGRAGRHDEARALIEQLGNTARAGYVTPYVLARAWLGLGQTDHAIGELQRAFIERAPQLVYLATDAAFDGIRGDETVVGITAGLAAAG
jgi:TolB-like protein/tetratricopeptide (TPR) repeat protein